MDLYERWIKDHPDLWNVKDIITAKEFSILIKRIKAKYARMDQKRKAYFITFTINPEWWHLNDETYDLIESYIIKQLKRKPLKLENVHLVREGGDAVDKHVHWHACFETTKNFKISSMSYYKKHYGNVYSDRSRCGNIEESLNYMNKQEKTRKIDN